MKLILLLVIANFVTAWWDSAHLMTAKRAYDILNKECLPCLLKAERLLKVLHKTKPNLTKNEGKYPFVECATWADIVKDKGKSGWQDEWHYMRRPLVIE